MMDNLNYLNCNYKIHIQYQVNDYININDVFIYPYYAANECDIILTDFDFIKYYRKQKLKEICLNQEIE